MSKKKFLVLFITFGLVFFQVSSGARLAPGSVPLVRPLQPLPADVAPNLSKNIESGNEPAQVLPVPGPPKSAIETTEKVPSERAAEEKSPKSSQVWFAMAVAGCALGYAIYLLLKKQKQGKK